MPLLRQSAEVEPQHFCSFYRRLVQQDFVDNGHADKLTTQLQEQACEKLHPVLAALVYRITSTRDDVMRDKDFVLPLNFVAVGCILLDFINRLSDHMVRNDFKSAFWRLFRQRLISLCLLLGLE